MYQGFFGSLCGAPDTIRTYDLQFRKLSLYPAELRARMRYSFYQISGSEKSVKLLVIAHDPSDPIQTFPHISRTVVNENDGPVESG